MTLIPPQDFRKTGQIHRLGPGAAMPNATDVLPGTLYYQSDYQRLMRSNGSAWELYAPDNLPRLDASNIWSGTQHFNNGVTFGNDRFSIAAEQLNQDLYGLAFDAYPDSGLVRPFQIYSNGHVSVPYGLYERNRGVALGEWQTIPFNAANFTAGGGGTWTVDAAAVYANRYTLIGKTMIWRIYVAWWQGTSVVAGQVTELRVAAPVTLAGGAMNVPVFIYDGNSAEIASSVYLGDYMTYVNVARRDAGAFNPGTVGVVATMTWEIQ